MKQLTASFPCSRGQSGSQGPARSVLCITSRRYCSSLAPVEMADQMTVRPSSWHAVGTCMRCDTPVGWRSGSRDMTLDPCFALYLGLIAGAFLEPKQRSAPQLHQSTTPRPGSPGKECSSSSDLAGPCSTLAAEIDDEVSELEPTPSPTEGPRYLFLDQRRWCFGSKSKALQGALHCYGLICRCIS